mgnify:CR=1 FL=1
MKHAKNYWDCLSQYEKWLLIKKYRFWEGLTDFPYNWIPDDLKEKIRQETEKKQP